MSIEFLDGDIKILQDDDLYHFTSDSIKLINFTKIKSNDILADFCSGSGVVGLGLCGKSNLIKSCVLFEMQTALANLSKESIILSGKQDIAKVENIKIQDIDRSYNDYFSVITCNPPYRKKGDGDKDLKEEIAICRHEIELELSEIVLTASRLLKFSGRLNMIHRADRLVDIICLFRQNKIEPKRLEFICPNGKSAPNLIMIEGVKGGNPSLKIDGFSGLI